MPYYTIHTAPDTGTATSGVPATMAETALPPEDYRPFATVAPTLLPPQITELHRQLAAWAGVGYSPGPVLPNRIWIGPDSGLAWYFANGTRPRRLTHIGLHPTLAAWLVLLDQVMETFVVVARARSIWSPAELAGAMPFLTPAFLPPALVAAAPDQWRHLAIALASAVADGPLRGEPTNRHWQDGSASPQASR